MRRTLLVVLAAAMSGAQTPAVIEGDWQGTLGVAPNSLRLVFHITKASDGTYLGQLDSLDQGASMPIDRVQVAGNAVHLELKGINGTFDGEFVSDGRIKGAWSQGAPMPLELTRATTSAAAGKPVPHPEALAEIVESVGGPMDIEIPAPPTAFPGHGGGINIAYELHLTNASPLELHVSRIEVLNGDASLVTYEGADLNGILHQFRADILDGRTLGSGLRAVAFVWVRINARAAVPKALRNRITVDGVPVESTVTLSTNPPVVLGPPLRGSDWAALNGPSNTSGHRRALIPIEGRLHLAQRFAIDWAKVGANGRTFSGDALPLENARIKF